MTKRILCIRETDKNFYAAVKKPFREHEEGFARFDFLASSVHLLNEGSQVFVFDRDNFGWGGASQEDEFIEQIWIAAQEIGGIATDLCLEPVHAGNKA